MDAFATKEWFLRKHEDGRLFGPLPFEQLSRWAWAAQVAPRDALSTDNETWIKAPMLAELGMDWLVEVTSEHYYGPTTLGAIEEFVRLGEIDSETFIINSCDGTRLQIADMPALLQAHDHREDYLHETNSPEAALPAPAMMGISLDLHDRIRELEQALREERRALAEAEKRYRELENKYRDIVTQSAASSHAL